MARRGRPKRIYSDNGTNFVGADNELRACLSRLNQEKIHNSLAPQGIESHLQPPLSPYFGNVWERLVQSIKKTLKAILNDRIVVKALRTALVETEGILNVTPISQVSSGACDFGGDHT